MTSAQRNTSVERRFDSLEQEAFLNLWRTYDRLRALEDELFAGWKLTAQQYNVLRLLRSVRPEKVPTLTLASRLITRAPDITRMIDRLEQSGLVEREQRAGNRRTVHVGITTAGVDLLARLDPQVRACHRRQLGHLGAEQLAALIELLDQARRPHETPQSEWRSSDGAT